MIELTKIHPTFWKDHTARLVKIVADLVKMKDFDEGVRSQACEIVMHLAEEVPAILRKISDIKTDFFPALVQMLTECETDMDVWAETFEEENGTNNNAYSTAISNLDRLSVQMKQTLTLEACGSLISECLKHSDWNVRQAGYMTSGLITASCKDHMRSNMDVAFQSACQGISDAHVRVKYAALFNLTQLLDHLKPLPQKKYHAELVPALLKIVNEEQTIKLKTCALNCLYQFIAGLIEEDKNEIEETKKSSEIINIYTDDLFKTLISNLNALISSNDQNELSMHMLDANMNVLNTAIDLIEEDFAKYFNEFMPLMVQILSVVKAETPEQKKIRARVIESMGVMIQSVSENKEFLPVV